MKEQKGFTLIELLAVIVILGIIAAIAIPAIGNVITKSDNKAKVQDALLVINAAKLYVADNKPDTEIFLSKDGGAVTGVTTASTPIKLGDYLERVKDGDFVVKVSFDATSGKYTYSITNHDAVKVVKGTAKNAGYALENELVNK
ncbi:type II secretion system protein [Bacillus sp. FJAT-49825]|uniref:Type II secretion system protein n=2 Tax=Neobacillus rhizophilus TaxID=2833579 RepID=A0A942YYX5_9BACI|nr:type II secretion system protein [Neobacillus rhizophilus]